MQNNNLVFKNEQKMWSDISPCPQMRSVGESYIIGQLGYGNTGKKKKYYIAKTAKN